MPLQRRHALVALALTAAVPTWAQAPPRLRVAGVYTVPVTQPWVGRIDAALKAAAARQVAREFPTTVFLMASNGRPQAPNYNVFDNHIHEAAYLSGKVASCMSASGKGGLVAGFPVPEVNRLINAFMAGVRDTNPRARFIVRFIDSWFDPAAARQVALAIGNVADLQAQFHDTVVASALWDMQPTIDEAVKVVAAGTLFARDYARYSSLRLKGSSLSPLGSFEGHVPVAVMERVKARTAAIVSGAFVVRADPGTPRSTLP